MSKQRRDEQKPERAKALITSKKEPTTATLLMARQITVFNPEDPEKAMSVVALFDTGCTENFIAERLSERLQLKRRSEGNLTVQGFTEADSSFSSADVRVGIKSKDGSGLVIQAATAPPSTRKIRMVDINEEE